MTYVTPKASLYLARLLGCRLMTPAEWGAAYSLMKQQSAKLPWVMKGWKLRGAKWQQELAGSLQEHDRFLLDRDIFYPPGANVDELKQRHSVWTDAQLGGGHLVNDSEDEQQLRTGDTALFRAIKYWGMDGRGFHDLVGNVAELTLEDGGSSQSLAPDPGVIETYFSKSENQARVRVIGGSALSPPELGFDQGLPVDFKQASNGYSDVGLRLAFTGPVTSLSNLAALSYIGPPSSSGTEEASKARLSH
jgi:hypothetical protein